MRKVLASGAMSAAAAVRFGFCRPTARPKWDGTMLARACRLWWRKKMPGRFAGFRACKDALTIFCEDTASVSSWRHRRHSQALNCPQV